jgi:hypothetical protein
MIGILPPNVAFVYLGAFGKRSLDGPRHPLEYVLGGLAFLALVGVLIILRRIAQRATSVQLQPVAVDSRGAPLRRAFVAAMIAAATALLVIGG